jgi:hypothetical protein
MEAYQQLVRGNPALVPAVYRALPIPVLMSLAEECQKSQAEELPGHATPPVVPTLAYRAAFESALANPGRLRTPARQRAAFLRQLERCSSVAEAAARAGINRTTAYRWRDQNPGFAARWAGAIARAAEEVNDNIVLRARRPERRQVIFRGRRMGEQQRFNDRLQIHVQKRLDAQRQRAEDRRTPPPAIDEAALAARIAALVMGHEASLAMTPAERASACDAKDLQGAPCRAT